MYILIQWDMDQDIQFHSLSSTVKFEYDEEFFLHLNVVILNLYKLTCDSYVLYEGECHFIISSFLKKKTSYDESDSLLNLKRKVCTYLSYT